jgi:DNA-directed RNA polymerase specialized sigma24 family protein
MTTRKSIDLQLKKWADANVAYEDGFWELISREPSPEEASQMIDSANRLIEQLGDDKLKQIAQLKVDGWTNREIAKKVGCVERSIERKLQRICLVWEAE